jgi:hypothetical protein
MDLKSAAGDVSNEAIGHGQNGVEWSHFATSPSGSDCARALRGAGYDVVFVDADHMLASRSGTPSVRIPVVEPLRPVQLSAILRVAGISATRFARYLEDAPAEGE